MSAFRRRNLLGSLLAAPLVAAVPVLLDSGDDASSDTAAPAVYGAARVADTDKLQLTASIRRQLVSAGLEAPVMDLFPETQGLIYRLSDTMVRASKSFNALLGATVTPQTEGKLEAPVGLRLQYKVTGIREDSEFVPPTLTDKSSGGQLDKACACGKGHSVIERDYPAFRVFVALHETAHYVAAGHGIDAGTLAQIVKAGSVQRPGAEFARNIQERIADSAATLYVLSNYGDAPRYVQQVIDWRNTRLEDGEHYSGSTIAATVENFRQQPIKGLSIVEATHRAGAIVTAQTDLPSEYEAAVAASTSLKTGAPATAIAKPLIERAIQSRRSLFGLK